MDRRNCREVSPRYFFLTPDDEVLTRRREIFFCGAEFGHFYDCLPISQMWRTFASLELEEYFFWFSLRIPQKILPFAPDLRIFFSFLRSFVPSYPEAGVNTQSDCPKDAYSLPEVKPPSRRTRGGRQPKCDARCAVRCQGHR